MSVYKTPHQCFIPSCIVCFDNYATPERQASAKLPAYTQSISKVNANNAISAHTESIEKDWAQIVGEVNTRGDKIISRWRGATSAARETWLLKAMPGMAKERTAHQEAFYRQKDMPSTFRNQHRRTFLLPYLTSQDLANDPTRLLRILDVRQRYKPAEWAWSDHETTRFGRDTGMLARRFSTTYYSTTADTYGLSVSYEDRPFHRWELVGFPAAELLFEAQRDLYRFLAAIVTLILEKAGPKNAGVAVWTRQAATNFLEFLPKNLREKSSLLHLPLQPDVAPQAYGTKEMRALLEQRSEAAEMHLEVLQTDPISLHNALIDVLQSECFTSISEDETWTAIAIELTQPLLSRARLWAAFALYVDILEAISALPNAQDLAIPWIVATIDLHFSTDIHQLLANSLYKDPAFDKLFKPEPEKVTDPGEPMPSIAAARKQAVERLKIYQAGGFTKFKEFQDNMLLWAVVELSTYSGTTMEPLKDVLPLLNHLLGSANLPSSRLPDLLTDISAALFIQKSIETCSPRPIKVRVPKVSDLKTWNIPVQLISSFARAGRQRTGAKDYETGFLKLDLTDNALSEQMREAGQRLKAFYAIKLTSRKNTIPWLEKAQTKKAAMDKFWEEVQKVYVKRLKQKMNPSEHQSQVEYWEDVKLLDHYKDTEFSDSLQRDIEALRAQQAADDLRREQDELSAAANEQQRAEEARFEAMSATPEKRPRPTDDDGSKDPKRNRVIGPDLPLAPVVAPPPVQQALVPKIPVKRESLVVFARLWPSQAGDIGAGGGVVRFKHFRAAMQDAGCDAEQGDGSKWAFSGVGLKIIVLHQPHGTQEAVVDKLLLQIYGKRLSKQYGWEFATFTERVVVEDEDVAIA